MVIIHRGLLGVADFVCRKRDFTDKIASVKIQSPYFSKFNDALLCLQA